LKALVNRIVCAVGFLEAFEAACLLLATAPLPLTALLGVFALLLEAFVEDFVPFAVLFLV
jgi:hypothetical protein